MASKSKLRGMLGERFRRAKEVAGGAREIAGNVKSVIRGGISNKRNKTKLMNKIMSGPLTEGTMGHKNYDTARSNIKNLINTGNFSGARAYAAEQRKKIAQQ